MGIRQDIREILKNGPLTAAEIRSSTGIEALATPLFQMVKEGWLSREGDDDASRFSLVADRPRGGLTAGKRKKKQAKKRAAKKAGPRKPRQLKQLKRRPFRAYVDAGGCIALFLNGDAIELDAMESAAVADLAFAHFTQGANA